jgi:hypothetical protein
LSTEKKNKCTKSRDFGAGFSVYGSGSTSATMSATVTVARWQKILPKSSNGRRKKRW